MLALLVAYIHGRGGVLDDRGQVIDTEHCGEFPDWYDEEYEDSEYTESNDVVIQTFFHRWRDRVVGLFGIALFLLGVSWLVRLAWIAGGWVGHSLMGVSGVLGNFVGAIGCLAAIVFLFILGFRLANARRDVRSHRGSRSLEDQRRIFYAVDQFQCCGACGFSLQDSVPESDGCTVCSECGAAWNTTNWIGFLQVDRAGMLQEYSKRDRKVSCVLDARGQMARVLSELTINELKERVRESKPPLLPVLVRELINERICPSCQAKLDKAPHPIDGALICDGCGLAWHTNTDARKHHTRKRIPDERFKQDPVFHKRPS